MSSTESYVVKNVCVWNATGLQSSRDVVVEKGTITAIKESGKEDVQGTTVIDGQGHVLMPLGVDPQVHLRVPGQPEKEEAVTGLTAALRGGIGALLTMPNTKPVIDNPEVVLQTKQILADAFDKTGVEVKISAAMTEGERGQKSVDYDALVEAGVSAFTDDGVGVVSDDLMREAFAASSKHGLPILQHAEYPGHAGVLAEGPVQKKLNMKPYPAAAETDMVKRDLELLREFPEARYHVLHVSSRDTLRLINEYRSKGLKASCEVSPHHLYFSSEDITEENQAFKMNPPLRSPQDREALQKGLADGSIAFVATDHAPHEESAKKQNLKTAAYGTTGLETSLRVLLTLYKQGKLSAERLVEVFSVEPAKFLGIDDRFGEISEGKKIKAVWVDVNCADSVITEDDLYSLSKNNCFLGTPLSGKILGVFNESRVEKF